MIVIVIADKKDSPGEIEFMVHTESDLLTPEGQDSSPANKVATTILQVFAQSKKDDERIIL